MDFIFVINNSLSEEFCTKIIEKYECSDNLKYEGVTFNGLNKNIKDTTDLKIPHIYDSENTWCEINKILYIELYKSLKMYITNINNIYKDLNHKFLNYTNVYDTGFQVQKYIANVGKYIYHNDYGNSIPDRRLSLLPSYQIDRLLIVKGILKFKDLVEINNLEKASKESI